MEISLFQPNADVDNNSALRRMQFCSWQWNVKSLSHSPISLSRSLWRAKTQKKRGVVFFYVIIQKCNSDMSEALLCSEQHYSIFTANSHTITNVFNFWSSLNFCRFGFRCEHVLVFVMFFFLWARKQFIWVCAREKWSGRELYFFG